MRLEGSERLSREVVRLPRHAVALDAPLGEHLTRSTDHGQDQVIEWHGSLPDRMAHGSDGSRPTSVEVDDPHQTGRAGAAQARSSRPPSPIVG